MRNTEAKEKTGNSGARTKCSALRRLVALFLVTVMCVSLLCACSSRKPFENSTDPYSDNTEIIYDLNRSTISLGKYLYFVAYYELIAQSMIQSYEQELGFTGDYFAQKYDETQTEADHYKSLIEETVIYYEIAKNAALDAGMSLSDDEIEECLVTAQLTYDSFSEKQIKNSGITVAGIDAALRTQELALKYEEYLQEKLAQKEDFLAIQSEEDQASYIRKGIDLVYEELKRQYTIVANQDLLDTIQIGKVTIVD
ncbi:MAG: hypothetical protein K6F44_05255 [Lachnospiraceae bacterium]|nr:hypothetical protein [Lachnospiraceae bacterium]